LYVLQVAAVVSILKAARQLGMVYSLARIVVPGQAEVIIPRKVLERALRHSSEALRGDVFQLICINPKLSLMPSKYFSSGAERDCKRLKVNPLRVNRMFFCCFVISVPAGSLLPKMQLVFNIQYLCSIKKETSLNGNIHPFLNRLNDSRQCSLLSRFLRFSRFMRDLA
jgi:hypothetical protein